MHPQPATISWTRDRTLMMQGATVGLVFVAGWLAGAAALAISLSSAVAVVGAERITWPQRRKPQRQVEPITVRAKGSVLPHG